MDTTDLDEDFVNFEAVSQTCSSSPLDDELSLLDNEARQRERRKSQRDCDKEERELAEDEEDERNNNNNNNNNNNYSMKMKLIEGGDGLNVTRSEDHLFTAFTYNSTNKRLTMIPIKYKIKEERRKVLKISINKLKKIDDPESWLCRSVLINNTMKKLQKEARDEKMQKQMNVNYTKNYLMKSSIEIDSDDFNCQLNNNNNNNTNNNNNNQLNGEICSLKMDDQDCFYQKEFIQKEKEDVFCQLNNNNNSNNNNKNNSNNNNNNNEEYDFTGLDKGKESISALSEEEDEDRSSRLITTATTTTTTTAAAGVDEEEEEEENSISNGVPLNEDFVEKIPSIKRCASRKRSLDEDGTASEILNLNDSDLKENGLNEMRKRIKTIESEEVDDSDVHDVLSQLYMPPTPRMLRENDDNDNDLNDNDGDDDDDDDDLNVVDIDSSYIDNIKTDCQTRKLPTDENELFDSHLLPKNDDDEKKKCFDHNDDDDDDDDDDKRKIADDLFNCFNVCETNFLNGEYCKKDNFDNFLYNNKGKDKDRTNGDGLCGKLIKGIDEEELIELEDEEDIKRRLSQSLSSHYHQRKIEKNCESFFEDGCDNQYSCGHTVNMFNDIQSVTFHNLIASLET